MSIPRFRELCLHGNLYVQSPVKEEILIRYRYGLAQVINFLDAIPNIELAIHRDFTSAVNQERPQDTNFYWRHIENAFTCRIPTGYYTFSLPVDLIEEDKQFPSRIYSRRLTSEANHYLAASMMIIKMCCPSITSLRTSNRDPAVWRGGYKLLAERFQLVKPYKAQELNDLISSFLLPPTVDTPLLFPFKEKPKKPLGFNYQQLVGRL